MSIETEISLFTGMGRRGFKYLSTAGTATYSTIEMCAIQALADCTVSTTSLDDNGDDLTSVSILAGTVIVGRFSSVTCAGVGGALLAYLVK